MISLVNDGLAIAVYGIHDKNKPERSASQEETLFMDACLINQ